MRSLKEKDITFAIHVKVQGSWGPFVAVEYLGSEVEFAAGDYAAMKASILEKLNDAVISQFSLLADPISETELCS